MLLTIVTVTKNDPDRLIVTIKSLHKYYKHNWIEHLIIEGSSNQKTKKIITKFLFKHPEIIIKCEKDFGIYDAMNKGIKTSSGRYLLFLNSGDKIFIEPQRLLKILNTRNSRGKEILCFPFYETLNGKQYLKYSLGNTVIKLPTSHQAMLFSREFITKYKYKSYYKIAADFELYHHAIPENIEHFNNAPPLCISECHGVASRNPLISYIEYCRVIWQKYSIEKSIFFSIKLLLKGIGLFVIKKIISESLYTKIKVIFYEIKK
jgi:glycosyltransferase involved in cell wall biosynthesis